MYRGSTVLSDLLLGSTIEKLSRIYTRTNFLGSKVNTWSKSQLIVKKSTHPSWMKITSEKDEHHPRRLKIHDPRRLNTHPMNSNFERKFKISPKNPDFCSKFHKSYINLLEINTETRLMKAKTSILTTI